jgi:hypothetical protein
MHSAYNLNDGYMGSGVRLLRSIRKYGKENHKIEILEFLPNRESLSMRESEIVNEILIEDNYCMNLRTGGNDHYVVSEETRKKMRDWERTDETCKKISESLSGRTFSDSHRNSIKEAKLNSTYVYTDEHKEKIKKGNLGKTVTEETKEKMKKPKSEETKKKMRKPKSEETRKKMSIAKKLLAEQRVKAKQETL